MPSIFSRIITGEIPAYVVAENARFIAFLDINPQVPGHTLVVPKVEVDNLWDLDKALLGEALLFAKPIAKAIERAFDCNRCGLSVVGLDVPHAHIHLLPVFDAGKAASEAGSISTGGDNGLQQIRDRILAAL